MSGTQEPSAGLEIEGLRAAGGPAGTLDLTVATGEVVAVLELPFVAERGLARLLAGFAARAKGRMRAGGGKLHGRTPHARPIGLASAAQPLPAGRSLVEAIALTLRLRGLAKDEAVRAAQDALDRLGLGARGAERTGRLSPLDSWRARFARAIAGNPPLLVFEDPGSDLDPAGRAILQAELHGLLAGTSAAVLLTGREPPLGLASRVVVVEAGRLAQSGKASVLVDAPATAGVARAFGPCNTVLGILEDVDDEGIGSLRHGSGCVLRGVAQEGMRQGADAWFVLRPDRLAVARGSAAALDPGALDATITATRDEGARIALELSLGRTEAPLSLLAHRLAPASWLRPGEPVALAWQAERARIVPG